KIACSREGDFSFCSCNASSPRPSHGPDHRHPAQDVEFEKRGYSVCWHRTFQINRLRRCSRKVEQGFGLAHIRSSKTNPNLVRLSPTKAPASEAVCGRVNGFGG